MNHKHPTITRWVVRNLPARPVRGMRDGHLVLGPLSQRSCVQARVPVQWCPTCNKEIADKIDLDVNES